jgi:hypothetical protein
MPTFEWKRFNKDDFVWDYDDPLAECEFETKKSRIALRDFAFLGGGRTLRALCEHYEQQYAEGRKPPTRSMSTLTNWSMVYQWMARVKRFEELEYTREKQAWRERHEQIREADWEQGSRLRSLADKMLKEAPNYTKTQRKYVTDPETGKKRLIEVQSIDANLLLQAIKLASAIQRTAADMTTERKEIIASVQLPDKDFESMSEKEVLNYLEKMREAADGLISQSKGNRQSAGASPGASDNNPE